MKKYFKNLTILLSAIFIFVAFSTIALAQDNTQEKPRPDFYETGPRLQVSLGSYDISFSPATCPSGQGKCTINWIGEYIGALYRYGVGLAVILAVIMIMLGGFMWLMSAGSPDKVGRAKEYITGALTGMFLALFSFLILYTINPRLVSLEGLSIPNANLEELDASGFKNNRDVFPEDSEAISDLDGFMDGCERSTGDNTNCYNLKVRNYEDYGSFYIYELQGNESIALYIVRQGTLVANEPPTYLVNGMKLTQRKNSDGTRYWEVFSL